MVKPATAPDRGQWESKTDNPEPVEVLQQATGDPKVSEDDLGAVKPSPFSGHSDDPDFYIDQNSKWRWRILGAAGEVVTSATEGFDSEEEAEADFKEQRKNGRLMDFIEFQGKSGRGFTTTETVGSTDKPAKKAAKKT